MDALKKQLLRLTIEEKKANLEKLKKELKVARRRRRRWSVQPAYLRMTFELRRADQISIAINYEGDGGGLYTLVARSLCAGR